MAIEEKVDVDVQYVEREAGSDDGSSQTSTRVKQQTRVDRIFNFVQLFFLSLTFMSGWEAMAGNLYSVFLNGGPQVLVWGALFVIAGALAQSASLAEMSSMQPIAGAQYHWTHLLAPQRFKNLVTWMQGWITWFGWLSMMAGIAYVTTAMLQGVVILNYPTFVFETWHTTMIIIAEITIQALINVYLFPVIPWIELAVGILHVSLYVVYMAILLAYAKPHTSEFVFFDRVNSAQTSGWTNSFITWNIGLLTPAWGFVGFDGAVHLSEEVKKAKDTVPRVMFWTIVLNGILAWSFILAIMYSAGDVQAALNSPTYQPFLYIVHHITGSVPAATAMGSGIAIISFCVSLAGLASLSRLTWAWARDGGLPSWFAFVNEKKKVPVRAVCLSSFIVVLLSLLNIPTTVAFQAFIALSTFSLFISYLISICCMIFTRLTHKSLQLGNWNLGRFGIYINIFAVLYTLYMMVWLPLPTTMPVSADSLNWAGPIAGMIIVLAAALWFVRGKKWEGPNPEVIRVAIKED